MPRREIIGALKRAAERKYGTTESEEARKFIWGRARKEFGWKPRKERINEAKENIKRATKRVREMRKEREIEGLG